MAVRLHSRAGRRRKRDRTILGAVLVAVAMIVSAFMMSRTREAEVPAAPVTTQVVAEYDTIALPVPVAVVPTGTKVHQIRTKLVSFPRHQLPEGALFSLDEFEDSVTIVPLPAGLPIFSANLALHTTTTNPVVERIPNGMRAMTVNVDATSAVEGWARSGAMVDVLLIQKDRTSVVAEKVKIISAERSLDPMDAEQSPSVPSTVTLLVTQEQCLAINTAIPLGKMAFALRGAADEENWQQGTYTAENLRGGSAAPVRERKISGYARYAGDKDEAFALAGDRWVKTEVIPEGFLVNTSRGEHAAQ
jgi:Flp pilus assembly protein CpaB